MENKCLEGKLLHNYVDMVAGTSTGSLIACGVAAGIEAELINSLFINSGPLIFPSKTKRFWSRAARTISQGVSAPKYDSKGLEKELKKIFSKSGKALKLKDLKIPVMVVSYDVLNRRPIVFKSTKKEHENYEVWQVCKASCSAPTYFPAHEMKLGRSISPLIDGGVVANNPSTCAVAEAKKLGNSLENILLASFGTGRSTRKISRDEAEEWGALEWVIPIIDVLFDASVEIVDYVNNQFLADGNCFRFQVVLDKAYDDLDNADATNINALQGIAENFLNGAEQGDEQLKKLCSKLKS